MHSKLIANFYFQTNLSLRRLARRKGNEEQKERFTKLANSVDEFTSCLLDPLETSTGDRHVFGESLDLLLDDAIDGEQKKVRNEIFKFKSKGY